MNIQLQRNKLIQQIQVINDVDLLKTIKSLLDYSAKKEIELNVPQWQQDIVLNRIKTAKETDYITIEESTKKLKKKYGF